MIMKRFLLVLICFLTVVEPSRVDTLVFAPWTSSSRSLLLEAGSW